MANIRITYPKFKAFTASGAFAVGYKLYTYASGTTTPITVYSDVELTTPHTNPIILNALGETEFYSENAVKLTLTDTDGNAQTGWPVDDVDPASVSAAEVSIVPAGSFVGEDVQTWADEVTTEIALKLDISDYDTTGTLGVMPSGIDMQKDFVGFEFDIGTDTSNDIDITAGACMNSTNEYQIKTATGFTKQIDAAWAVGTNAGGMLSGAVGASKTYDLYLLRKDSDSSVDAGFLEMGTALAGNLPSGYSYSRWFGYVFTDSSSNLIPFLFSPGQHAIQIVSADSLRVLDTFSDTAYVDISSTLQGYIETDRAVVSVGVRGSGGTAGELHISLDGTDLYGQITGNSTATWTATGVHAWGERTKYIGIDTLLGVGTIYAKRVDADVHVFLRKIVFNR